MRRIPPPVYGLPIKAIARICKVSLKTARRWKQGQAVPPQTALMMLSGDLGCFDPSWTGWRLQNGFLVSPEGWTASPGDVLSIQLTQAQLSAYRSENRALKTLLEGVQFEDQPTPENWTIALDG